MAYFEAVGYYGRMVYGSYDQVAIQAAKWHILRLLVTMHHYIKPCFTVLRIDFFHFNSSAGSFYKDEKLATTAEFEIVSSEIP